VSYGYLLIPDYLAQYNTQSRPVNRNRGEIIYLPHLPVSPSPPEERGRDIKKRGFAPLRYPCLGWWMWVSLGWLGEVLAFI